MILKLTSNASAKGQGHVINLSYLKYLQRGLGKSGQRPYLLDYQWSVKLTTLATLALNAAIILSQCGKRVCCVWRDGPITR